MLQYGNWRCISKSECKEKISHYNDLTIDQERPYKNYEGECLEYCPPKTEEIRVDEFNWTCKVYKTYFFFI